MRRMIRITIMTLLVGLLAQHHGGQLLGQGTHTPELASLLKDLKDDEWQIRWYAAQALGDKKDSAAVEPLIDVLATDKNSYVRAMAAWALGEIKDRRAISPLIGALRDESVGVRKRAASALAEITGENFGKDAQKWEKWWSENKASYK